MKYCYGATQLLTLDVSGIKNKVFLNLTNNFINDLAKSLNFKCEDYYLGFDKLDNELILTIDGKYIQIFGSSVLRKSIKKLLATKKYSPLKEKCISMVKSDEHTM